MFFFPMLAQNIDRGYPLEMKRFHRASTVHAPYNKTRKKCQTGRCLRRQQYSTSNKQSQLTLTISL